MSNERVRLYGMFVIILGIMTVLTVYIREMNLSDVYTGEVLLLSEE